MHETILLQDYSSFSSCLLNGKRRCRSWESLEKRCTYITGHTRTHVHACGHTCGHISAPLCTGTHLLAAVSTAVQDPSPCFRQEACTLSEILAPVVALFLPLWTSTWLQDFAFPPAGHKVPLFRVPLPASAVLWVLTAASLAAVRPPAAGLVNKCACATTCVRGAPQTTGGPGSALHPGRARCSPDLLAARLSGMYPPPRFRGPSRLLVDGSRVAPGVSCVVDAPRLTATATCALNGLLPRSTLRLLAQGLTRTERPFFTVCTLRRPPSPAFGITAKGCPVEAFHPRPPRSTVMGERGQACGCSVLPGNMATGEQRAPVGSLSRPGAQLWASRGRPWVLCPAGTNQRQHWV